MVNFNFGELRGFHGRWQLGGPRHAHLRRLVGGGVRGGAGDAVADAAERFSKEEMAAAKKAVSERKEAERSLAGIATGTERDISKTERSAARETERADREAARRAAAEKRTAERTLDRTGRRSLGSRRRGYRRGSIGRGLYRGLGSGLMLTRLGMLLHKSAATKAAAKKKAAPKKKAAAKKKAAPKKPVVRVIKPAKAPVGKATAGTKGRSAVRGQVAKPSPEVMARLKQYVATP